MPDPTSGPPAGHSAAPPAGPGVATGRSWRAPAPHTLLGYAVLIGTVAAYAGFYRHRLAHFPTPYDYTSVIDAALPLVFAAIGQSLVVLTGGIDLSVGGIMGLCVGLAALHLHGGPAGVAVWLVAVPLVGAAAGAVNGVLVARGRIAPILVTLATLSIYDGLALKVLPEPGGSVPAGVTAALANPNVPVGLVYVALAAGAWWVLRRTRFGMNVYAVGNDEPAARAVGVPVNPVKICAYAGAGLCYGLAALFYVATTTSGDPNAGTSYILTSIAAVVIGGIALAGGRGSAMGAVAGAFALTLVVDVLFFAGIDQQYESFFQGLFLIVAVLLGGVVTMATRLRKGAR